MSYWVPKGGLPGQTELTTDRAAFTAARIPVSSGAEASRASIRRGTARREPTIRA